MSQLEPSKGDESGFESAKRYPIGSPSRGKSQLVEIFNDLELPFDPYLSLGLSRGSDMLRRVGVSNCELSIGMIDPITNQRPSFEEWHASNLDHYTRLQKLGQGIIRSRKLNQLLQDEIGSLVSSVIFPTLFRMERSFPAIVKVQVCSLPDALNNQEGRAPASCLIAFNSADEISPFVTEIFQDELFKIFNRACNKWIKGNIRDALEENPCFGGFIFNYTWLSSWANSVTSYLICSTENSAKSKAAGAQRAAKINEARDFLRLYQGELEALVAEVMLFDLLPMLESSVGKLPYGLSATANCLLDSSMMLVDPEAEAVSDSPPVEGVTKDCGRGDVVSLCKERLAKKIDDYCRSAVFPALLNNVKDSAKHVKGIGVSFSLKISEINGEDPE
jgi:hypothetical protein